jgi:hypothetical protein
MWGAMADRAVGLSVLRNGHIWKGRFVVTVLPGRYPSDEMRGRLGKQGMYTACALSLSIFRKSFGLYPLQWCRRIRWRGDRTMGSSRRRDRAAGAGVVTSRVALKPPP